ncbi:MAG: SGNH/GDSL hydrolase family protein, partial [Nitrospinota bacterium]
RVINAGTPGYTAYQSARRLECQLLRLSPDLVLVYHLWNDVKHFSRSDTAALIRYLEAHGRFNERSTLNALTGRIPVFDELTRWSQLAARLRFALIKLVRHLNKVDDEGRKKKSLNERIHPNGVDFYRRNLLAIRALLAARGIPLFIVKQATLVRPNNTPRERKRIVYAYSGFDPPTLLAAIRKG